MHNSLVTTFHFVHHAPFDNSSLPCAQVSRSSSSLNRYLVVDLNDFHHNLHDFLDFLFLQGFLVHLHEVDLHVDDVHHASFRVDFKIRFYHLYLYFYWYLSRKHFLVILHWMRYQQLSSLHL